MFTVQTLAKVFANVWQRCTDLLQLHVSGSSRNSMWNMGRVENTRGIARFSCESTAFLSLYSFPFYPHEKNGKVGTYYRTGSCWQCSGLFVACKTECKRVWFPSTKIDQYRNGSKYVRNTSKRLRCDTVQGRATAIVVLSSRHSSAIHDERISTLAKVRIMESVSSDEEPPEHLCCLSREGRNPLGERVGN